MTERMDPGGSYMWTRHSFLGDGERNRVDVMKKHSGWGIVSEHFVPAVNGLPAQLQILWRRVYCPTCSCDWDLCTCKVEQPAAPEPEAAPEQTKLERWYTEAGLAPCTNCEFMTTKRHKDKPWCFRDCCPKELAEHSYANYQVGARVTLDKVRPLQWWTFFRLGGEPRWLRGLRIFRNGAYLWLPFNRSEYRESSASPDSTEVTLAPPPECDIDLLSPGSVFVFRSGAPADCFPGLYKVTSRAIETGASVTVRDLTSGYVRKVARTTRVLLVLPRLSVPRFTYIGLVEGDFHVPCDDEDRPLQATGNVCLWTDKYNFTRWRKLKLLSTSWGVSATGNLPCRIFECEDVDEAGSVFYLDEYTLVVPAKE